MKTNIKKFFSLLISLAVILSMTSVMTVMAVYGEDGCTIEGCELLHCVGSACPGGCDEPIEGCKDYVPAGLTCVGTDCPGDCDEPIEGCKDYVPAGLTCVGTDCPGGCVEPIKGCKDYVAGDDEPADGNYEINYIEEKIYFGAEGDFEGTPIYMYAVGLKKAYSAYDPKLAADKKVLDGIAWYPVYGDWVDISKLIPKKPTTTDKPYHIAIKVIDGGQIFCDTLTGRPQFKIKDYTDIKYNPVTEVVEGVDAKFEYRFVAHKNVGAEWIQKDGTGNISVSVIHAPTGGTLEIRLASTEDTDGNLIPASASGKIKVPKAPKTPNVTVADGKLKGTTNKMQWSIDGETWTDIGERDTAVTDAMKGKTVQIRVKQNNKNPASAIFEITVEGGSSGNEEPDADQAAVDAEKAKYETAVTIANTVAVETDVTPTIATLKTGAIADSNITLSYAIKTDDGGLLDITGNVVKLAKQVDYDDGESDGTAVVTITFTKNGKTATLDVTVTIKEQANPAP